MDDHVEQSGGEGTLMAIFFVGAVALVSFIAGVIVGFVIRMVVGG
jgi:hypothetical protein